MRIADLQSCVSPTNAMIDHVQAKTCYKKTQHTTLWSENRNMLLLGSPAPLGNGHRLRFGPLTGLKRREQRSHREATCCHFAVFAEFPTELDVHRNFHHESQKINILIPLDGCNSRFVGRLEHHCRKKLPICDHKIAH